MPENKLIAVDLKIAELRAQIATGKANSQICALELADLVKERDDLLRKLFPTQENPPNQSQTSSDH